MVLVWRPICCSFSLASPEYFCFLNLTLFCLSAWPYFQRHPYFHNSPQLISVLPFYLQPCYFNTQYFIFSFVLHQVAIALRCKVTWPTYRYYLCLSQPWHKGHLIQMPLRHKGGTHKVTHLLNHSAWKSTLKPERYINHSNSTSNFNHIKYKTKDGVLCPF